MRSLEKGDESKYIFQKVKFHDQFALKHRIIFSFVKNKSQFHKRTRWTAIATADKTSGRLSISRNWDLNAINANGAAAINCVTER